MNFFSQITGLNEKKKDKIINYTVKKKIKDSIKKTTILFLGKESALLNRYSG